jgi:hypothetical protein
MPSLESLDGLSDLSDFFSPGVSEELRRLALRKVFATPRYNVTDGLDDYAGDYSHYRPLGDLVTAGLRRHRERLERVAARATREPGEGSSSPSESAPEPEAGAPQEAVPPARQDPSGLA